MIAAEGAVVELVAVIVRWAETNSDPRQVGHWLDHSNRLRRPTAAADRPKRRGKVSDAAGAAWTMGETRRHDRRIPKVLRLKIGHVVEHDVRKSFFFVAGKEPAEDRVAVEARVTPPHQTRRRIDERGSTPVTDNGKIKPVIGHGVANASAREICSSQRRTSAGRSKRAVMPGTSLPTEMPMPLKSGRIPNTPRSVTSSPMKVGGRFENGAEVINSRTAVALVQPVCLISSTSLPGKSSIEPASSWEQILAAAARTTLSLCGASR